MNSDRRLAGIVLSLLESGVDVLVMGGHAVRYYGVSRNTDDFDLMASVISTQVLDAMVSSIKDLAHARPEPVWRHHDFARFEIGKLSDGRGEYLEFWLRNHLLDEFSALKGRAELGVYGGSQIPFLSLGDLIRSKETERESDWADIALLEEIQDNRLIAAHHSPADAPAVLSHLRSRRGMDRALAQGLVDDPSIVDQAITLCANEITFAFLWPYSSRTLAQSQFVRSGAPWAAPLMQEKAGTPRHFAIIEIARRAYRRQAVEDDRADKQHHLE